MRLRSFFPKSLFGRAALILVLLIIVLQLITSVAFIQRYFEGITKQLTQSVVVELSLIRKAANTAPTLTAAARHVQSEAQKYNMSASFPSANGSFPKVADAWAWSDLTGQAVVRRLRADMPDITSIDLASLDGHMRAILPTSYGPMQVIVLRGRLSARNPHQLLVIIFASSILMTLIAFVFLRQQLRPITTLAEAAEAFGNGKTKPYHPRGATEVRAAGKAFLDMRARIERSLEARTLMLSGISHDLRTPLTRLRLGLSILPEDRDTSDLLGDVREMEHMVNEFLAFARGDAMEEPQLAEPRALAYQIYENAARGSHKLHLILPPHTASGGDIPPIKLRRQSIIRAVENLIGNAYQHGDIAQLTLTNSQHHICFTVEDNGPGIPESEWDIVTAPFVRLSDARSRGQNQGVGLGLSIVADVAHSHGGTLSLSRSPQLGGLRAELRLAR